MNSTSADCLPPQAADRCIMIAEAHRWPRAFISGLPTIVSSLPSNDLSTCAQTMRCECLFETLEDQLIRMQRCKFGK